MEHNEDRVKIIFSISSEGFELLNKGSVKLSSGGLRNSDGTYYEVAKPVFFDPSFKYKELDLTTEEALGKTIENTAKNLDLLKEELVALNSVSWLNNSIQCQTYEMFYEGFQIIISQLNHISSHLARLEKKLDSHDNYDRLETFIKYKNSLQSMGEFLNGKNINFSSIYMGFSKELNDISAYFNRLLNELNSNEYADDRLILETILTLCGPYSYIVRKFTALWYYENEIFPLKSYENWVSSISDIINSKSFKNRVFYHLRVNSKCLLEDVFASRNKLIFHIEDLIDNFQLEKKYVLSHTKEEYFNIDKSIQMKYEAGDYLFNKGYIFFVID